MNSKLELVLYTVSTSLDNHNNITREIIEERVRRTPEYLGITLSEEEIVMIIKKIEASYQITMSLGSTLIDNEHKPWLIANSDKIDWNYWIKYKKWLINEGYSPNIIGQMDLVTNEILDLLQNPKDDGQWQRKGLVVGHVQSGKTANYLGVICKALDAGYRVIIVLAGLLNSLRKQTQGRVDYGVVGLDSGLMLEDPPKRKIIGVGKYYPSRFPVTITTIRADFDNGIANRLQASIDQFSSPIVFVIKKNVKILRNLIYWIKNNNNDLSQLPMLLIDDEADHASINTNREDLDPTKTNDRIRELLKIFPKKVYLGYTATPFANIFINPETPEEMMNDLFPENFIKSLDAPSNYFGANKIFREDGVNAIRVIDDYDGFLKLKHKKTDIPDFLSESLKEAVRVFVIVCACRMLRGQVTKHNSMLVNVSRFTDIQTSLKVLIHNYISKLRDAVNNYHALKKNEAIKNYIILEIFKTYQKEFSDFEMNWVAIQKVLRKAIYRIEVIEVNSSKNAVKDIDYSKRNYPEGRHIITVGGLSLSRGITLEGLSVSYFLRNSIMYDTLMQMGRWFGYRDGYENLCRIYLTEQASGWYSHISNATDELRDEFRKMEALNKSPKDFGLCVRNHEVSLIVTARNKMRSAKKVTREFDHTGRLIETSRLFISDKIVKSNLELAANLLKSIKRDGIKVELEGTLHTLWKNVNYMAVYDFVESFINHPESSLTDSNTIKRYVQDLFLSDNINEWNVLFVSVKSSTYDTKVVIKQKELQFILPVHRYTAKLCNNNKGVMLSQRKLGSEGIDKIDLDKGAEREVPLLMLYILDCRRAGHKNIPIFKNGVAAYGISFPGEKNGRRISKLASYQVNPIWWKKQYGSGFEDDNDLKGEFDG